VRRQIRPVKIERGVEQIHPNWRKRLHAAFDIPPDELFASVSDDREAILAAFQKRAAK